MKVAIYALDVNDEQFADLRAWVAAKRFTEIMEYRDTTPLRGRSGKKELWRLLEDARERKFAFLYVISLKNIDFADPMNFLLLIVTLKELGVRLISQAEPWTDMSAENLSIVYLAYCLHLDSEREMSNRSRTRRTRPKNNNKPKGARDSDKCKWIGVHRIKGTSDGILKILKWFRSHLINKRS